MSTRALVIFLGINVVCSVVIGYKYFSKENELKTTTPIIQQQSIFSEPKNDSKVNVNVDKNKTISNDISTQKVQSKSIQNSNVPLLSNSRKESDSMVQHIINLKQNNNDLPIANAGDIPSTNGLSDKTPNQTSNSKSANQKICTILGPLVLKDKATMDLILSKDSNAGKNDIEISQKPIFEIYWNLGKDRENAEILFQKQKQNGTMQEENFILVQDENKDWIVSVAEINSTIEYAKTITNQLATTGKKYNAGGKWSYKIKPNAYFYQFNDFSQIDEKTKTSFNVMLGINKTPCY